MTRAELQGGQKSRSDALANGHEVRSTNLTARAIFAAFTNTLYVRTAMLPTAVEARLCCIPHSSQECRVEESAYCRAHSQQSEMLYVERELRNESQYNAPSTARGDKAGVKLNTSPGTLKAAFLAATNGVQT